LKFGNVESEQVEKAAIDTDETMMQSLNASEAIQRIEGGWVPYIIDVRGRREIDQNKLARSDDFCPHDEIVSVIPHIPDDRDVLLYCLSGMRSSLAIAHLIQSGFDSTRLFNLEDGIAGWSAVDPDGIIHG
jgi:rhodanese-related sulfurtransferase